MVWLETAGKSMPPLENPDMNERESDIERIPAVWKEIHIRARLSAYKTTITL